MMLFVRSSRADTKFDTTVGHIEDIIMGEYMHFAHVILPLRTIMLLRDVNEAMLED